MTAQPSTRNNTESERRIPSLDGIRALSVSLVMVVHLLGTRNFPLSRDSLPLESVAYLAMRIFFVLSGFLITGILLREIDRAGTINLPRFYFKRTFRIFPAYYVFLIVMAGASWLGVLQFGSGDLLRAVTYTSNYDHGLAWYVGHTWSLSVEEQFYMLWPAVLLLLGVKRASWALLVIVVVLPLWRIALLALPQGAYGLGIFQAEVGHTFDTTADILAVGCLFAIFRSRLWTFPAYRRVLQSRFVFLFAVLAVAIPFIPELVLNANRTFRYAVLTVVQVVGYPVVNLSVALLMDWAMRSPHAAAGRLLNHRWVVRWGVMSYSVYIWQQVFLNRHDQHFLTSFPLNVILVIGVSWMSYRFIETPMLVLRDRLDWKRKPSHSPHGATAAVPEFQSAVASEVQPT